jgi:hypothetical protein
LVTWSHQFMFLTYALLGLSLPAPGCVSLLQGHTGCHQLDTLGVINWCLDCKYE